MLAKSLVLQLPFLCPPPTQLLGFSVEQCRYFTKGCCLDVRVIWLLHLSPHQLPGLIQLIWLARWVCPSSLTALCVSSQSCALSRRGQLSPIDEVQSSVKGIRVAVLPCQTLPTSSQDCCLPICIQSWKKARKKKKTCPRVFLTKL